MLKSLVLEKVQHISTYWYPQKKQRIGPTIETR